MTRSPGRLALAAALLTVLFILPAADALYCQRDNCYELLGVKREATKIEIRRAFRRLSTEMHPDKRPNDPKAQETFRRLNSAYEALIDDNKRAKYNDYLDNPGKYLDFLMQISPEIYAPKSNVFLVLTGMIGLITLIHWITMNHNYKETLRRVKDSQDFKREVTRLMKTKKAATKEEAESMIDLDVVGLEEPHWSNLIVVKAVTLAPEAGKFVLWNVKWVLLYKLLKRPYTDSDKEYLIRRNMELSGEVWDEISEKEKAEFVEKELWDEEKCDDFMRMKRIEMNRLGKGKKKKKHTPQFYSETAEVNMNNGDMQMSM